MFHRGGSEKFNKDDETTQRLVPHDHRDEEHDASPESQNDEFYCSFSINSISAKSFEEDIELKSYYSNEKEDNFDELLEQAGSFGLFQILVVFLMSIPMVLTVPISMFSQIFTTHSPDHWCHIPELQNFHLTTEQVKSLCIPKLNKDKFDSCKMYSINFSQYLTDNPESDFQANNSWPTTNCQYGWDYDHSTFQSTLVTEWNLVCDKKVAATLANTFYNGFMLLGGTFCGFLSDKMGRKKLLFFSLAAQILCGVGAALAPNIYVWTIFRVVVAAAMSIYFAIYIIALETVGARYRGTIALLVVTATGVGVVLISGMAYFVRDWRQLSLISCTPFAISFLFIEIYPESPRWLLSKNKLDELQSLLNRIAKFNGRDSKNINVKSIKFEKETNETKNVSMMSLVKTPNLRKNVFILTYIGFVNHMLYFGLSFFLPALGENIFLSVVLTGLAEIPGFFIGYKLMDKIGRRWTVAITFLLAGICNIIALNLKILSKAGSIALCVFAKTMTTANQMPLVPFISEVLPTPLRNVGVAIIMNVGSIGVIFVPTILLYGTEYLRIPFTVLGVLAITSAAVALLLPETLNKNLSDTVRGAETIGDDSGK